MAEFISLYTFTLFIIAITSYAIYNYFKNQRFWRMISKFNGEKTLPFIGNAHQFGTNSVDILKNLERMWENSDRSTFKAQLGNIVFVMLCDPESIEVILSHNKEIKKLDDYSFMSRWLGDGLLLSEGHKWRRQRKIITPTFHFKILEQFLGVFEEKSDVFIKKIAANKGKVFDIYQYVTLLALDIICESAMGTNVNAQEDSDSAYVKAIYEISEIIHHRTFSFWKRPEILYRLSSDYREELKNINIIHGLTNKVIQSRKIHILNKNTNNIPKNNVDDDDDNVYSAKNKVAFLDLLLMSKTPEGESLPDEVIREEVDTFMFEGHDTTSSGISFAIYLLANNPDAQKIAFEEQFTIFGNDLNKQPTYANLQEMNYLERVIKETLRMYPSVPFYGRKIVDDLTLPDGSVIPGGAFVTVQLYCMSKNPKYYPDPYKFIPDRFLPENASTRHPYLSVPFSAGPRNCIGQKFAMLEMKSTLSKILRNFELLSGGPGTEPQLAAELILRSKNGINIKIEDRVYN